MANTEPSKQTNVRLPLPYHEQLQRAAQQQGKAVGTLARELLMSALDGADHSPAAAVDSHIDTDAFMERFDSIEDSIGVVSTTMHVALRALLKSLIHEPLERRETAQILDAYLGPLPTASRT